MPRKNLLFLQEAIVVALINQPSRTASFEEIANFIEQRGLFSVRKGNISLAKQLMLRSTLSKGKYKHLFDEIGAGYIRLRDSYAVFGIMLYNSLDNILDSHCKLYKSNPETIRVKDLKMNGFREVSLSASDIICIATREKSGEKKYIYVLERDIIGQSAIGVYTINKNLNDLKDLFDPLSHYLAMLSDSVIINVAFYQLSGKKELQPILPFSEIKELSPFKFSASKAAKEYYRIFLKVQEAYQHRISFEKSILDWKKQHSH